MSVAPTPTPTLTYADGATDLASGEDLAPELLERWRAGTRWLWASTFLSPACIGVCFLHMSTEASPASALVLTLVFAATAITAFFAQKRLEIPHIQRPMGPFGFLGEIIAGVGLALLCLAAWVASLTVNRYVPRNEEAWVMIAGLGFLALTVGLPRFLPQYRLLSDVQRQVNRRSGHGFILGIGAGKLIGDGVLVGCMALALLSVPARTEDITIFFAFGALMVGFPAYAIVWIIAAVGHGILTANVNRACRTHGI